MERIMKKTADKKIIAFLKLICSVAFLVSFIMFWVFQVVLPKESDFGVYTCEAFLSGWQQVTEDGSLVDFEPTGMLPVEQEKGSTYTAVAKVTPDMVEMGWLSFRSIRQDMKIYIGDRLAVDYDTLETRLAGRTSVPKYLFVHLFHTDAGQEIRVEFASDTAYSGVMREVYYGTLAGIWLKYLRDGSMETACTLLIMALCLLIMISCQATWAITHENLPIGFLACGIFLIAAWSFCQLDLRQLVFSNVSIVGDYAFISLALLPVPILLYFNDIQNYRYKKLYIPLIITGVITAFTTILLHFINVVDFQSSVYILLLEAILTVVLVIASTIIDIVCKQYHDYLIIIIGFAGLGIASIVQMIFYLKRDSLYTHAPLLIGMSVLLITATIKSIQGTIRTSKERDDEREKGILKERFLANMSHEIRTPLNAIAGMNQVILEESNQEEVIGYAKDVEAATKSLLMLVNDILDFSKIESGKLDIIPCEYSVSQLLNEAYSMVSGKAEAKGILLIFKTSEKIPERLYGDDGRILQVLINILSNGVKYTQNGMVYLQTGFTQDGSDNGAGTLEFIVKDTGIGIKEEDIDKIFESFERVDIKKNKSIEGTGLGLAITKNLLNLMNGSITVSSEYGKGSTFTIKIPQKIVNGTEYITEYRPGTRQNRILRNEAIPAVEAVSNVAERGAGAAVTKRSKVLVVDDSELNIKVAVLFLKNTDIDVDSCHSGRECLMLIEKNDYDVILLDHMMPELDGIETFRLMKSRTSGRNMNTPVIMMTANAIEGLREEYLAEGFDDYLTKPIKKEEYIAIIKKHIT